MQHKFTRKCKALKTHRFSRILTFKNNHAMKNRKYTFGILWLALLLLLPLSHTLAQSSDDELPDTTYDRIFKVHPLQIGEIYFSYEKMRTARISNEFGLSYVYQGFLKSGDFLPDAVKVGGAQVRMSQRYYTSKKHDGVPFGFFHGPIFGYRFMAFEEGALGSPSESPSSPGSRVVGRLYQNTLELSYQLGGQFMLGKRFTGEVSAALGARLKYALSKNADELLPDNIIGHTLASEPNSAIFVTPSPQLNVSVGYAF